MRIAVISSEQVQKAEGVYSTNSTFFQLLKKATNYFDELTVICRHDRKDKQKKLFQIGLDWFDVLTFKAGIKNKYVSIIVESPLIFVKLLIHVYRIRSRIDVIWIPEIRMVGAIAYLVAKVLKIPAFFYLRGNNFREAKNRNTTKPTFVRSIYSVGIYLEYILGKLLVNKTLTFVCGEELYAMYKTRNNKVCRFVSSLIEKDNISAHAKNISGKLNINLLFVGRLVNYKGLEYLIKALPSIVHRYSKVTRQLHLIIVGKGDDEIRLKEIINQNDISEYISFRGYITDRNTLYSIYDECDILIIPSLTEGTPKIIPEAMARGLPIIATNAGGLPYMIKDGEAGIIVESANSREIGESIKYILEHPIVYSEMSHSALKTAASYTSDRQFAMMIKQTSSIC